MKRFFLRRGSTGRALFGVGLFAFAVAQAAGAQPHLVSDLLRSRGGEFHASPSQGIEQEGVLYFPAQDPQHGWELWRSDGTAEGSYRLTDTCPGTCDGGGSVLGFFHGYLYFQGNDLEHGTEIWRTDATVGGEELLGDLCPGTCGTYPYWIEWRGVLWFLSPEENATPVLWSSDGTPAGTKPVANLCTDLGMCEFGNYSSASVSASPSGQGFFLWIRTASYVLSLYRTDGTAEGTVLLHRFANPYLAAEAGSEKHEGREKRGVGPIEGTNADTVDTAEPLYVLDGFELWTSDATPAGTHLVRNLEGMVADRSLNSVRVLDGIWYATFHNGEWLRSDGTAEGTLKLADVGYGYIPTVARIGAAVFVVTSGSVWRTGGTPETTSRFDAPLGDVLTVVERPGRLFVAGYVSGGTVWSTDGTAAGTHRINLHGRPKPDQYEMAGLHDGVVITRGNYRELWRVDEAGAERLHEFQPTNGGSGPFDQIVFGGKLLFSSLAGARGSKLFTSDGTASGTTAVTPFVGYGASLLTQAGGLVYFTAGNRVWKTDGTPSGTRFFRPEYYYSTHQMTAPIGVLGGRFVFGANLKLYPLRCDPGDTEPWVSDGTGRGTKQILNLNPYDEYGGGSSQCDTVALSSDPGSGVVLGSIALFAADDLVHGRELFATDGTKEGTRLVADVNPKLMPNTISEPPVPALIGVGSNPGDLVRAGSRVFFAADDGETGRELWVTDGTLRGTRRVADLVPGLGGSAPHDLLAVGESVYFFAAYGQGEGLYRSDSSRAGTILVSDLAGATQTRELTSARGRLFFVAYRPASGTELWTSAGSSPTTRMVADLRPGRRGSLPRFLKAVGDRVVFAAADGTSGLEPWSSDGTPEGTLRWGDLAPGRDASTPGPFSIANGQLLFGADDGEHGRELWAIPLAEVLAPAPR